MQIVQHNPINYLVFTSFSSRQPLQKAYNWMLTQTHAKWELPAYLFALFSEYFLQFKVQLDPLESFGKAFIMDNLQACSCTIPKDHESISRAIYSQKLSIYRNTLPQWSGKNMERSNTTKWPCFHKISPYTLSEICKTDFTGKVLLWKLRSSSHSKDRTDGGMRRTRDI